MRTDPRYVELMHAEIDGVISDAERAALLEFLASSPAAREQLDQLRRLSATLAVIGQVEPPAELKAGILRSARAAQAQEPLPLLQRVRNFWPGARVVLAYGYAVAAGLVLGMAVIHWAPSEGRAPRGINPSELVGTMTPHAGDSAIGLIQKVPVQFPGGSGTATLRRTEAGYTIEFDIECSKPVEVVLGFDPGKVLFRGLAQDPEAIRNLHADEDRVAWIQDGHHRLAVLLSRRKPAATGLALDFSFQGKLLQHNDLSIPSEG